MSLNNFIPTVWSENLLTAMDKAYIGVANCNRDFEGDIRSYGDSVRICGVGQVTIFDYKKNQDMSALAQTLDSEYKTLFINQAKAFNFQIDDVDKAQTTPKAMDHALKNAANALADLADKYIFSLYKNAEVETVEGTVTENTVLDMLILARTYLMMNNVNDANDIVIEVSPAIAGLILKAKLNVTGSENLLETGCIGRVAGCKVYVSNNVETDGTAYMCYVRSKRAIAFAEQLSEIDAYRPEKRFADAVKGLHLYGAQVVYPNELLVLKLTPDLSEIVA